MQPKHDGPWPGNMTFYIDVAVDVALAAGFDEAVIHFGDAALD